MAAVICKAFGELCSAAGQVVCLPCKALGIGCASAGEVLKSPFFPYLALTFTLNLPGAYYGLRAIATDCPDLSSWLLGNAVLCVVHMVAAMYIVNKIRDSSTTNQSNDVEEGTFYTNFSIPKENETGAPNSCSRIKHVLCYDKPMAVYIVVFVGWLLWLSVGVSRRLGSNDDGDCEHFVNVAISCGYMYFSLVFIAFGCSLCCLR